LSRPEQFKITDPDERIVAGWASVEIVDLQKDIIPVKVLERAMYKYMDRGGHILYHHSNVPVGKVLRWEVKKHPETGKYGVWIEAKIFNEYETDNIVWNAIKQGKIKGFSIGGVGKEKKVKIKDADGKEQEVDLVTDIELNEISLVEEPANPLAKIEQINWYAKSNDAVKKSVNRITSDYSVVDDDIVRIVFVIEGDNVGELEDKVRDILVAVSRAGDYGGREVFVTASGNKIMADILVKKDFFDIAKRYADELFRRDFGVDIDWTVKGIVKEATDIEKACKDRYLVCSGDECHFKEMTCPDNPNHKSRFCGCVRYMMTCNGKSLESAKKICAKIYHEKYGKSLSKDIDWYEDIISGKKYIVEIETVEGEDGENLFIARIRNPDNGDIIVETEPLYTEEEAIDVAYDLLESKEGMVKALVPIMKPFAGFKNFDECVDTMRKRGYDKDSARRICGWLYWRYERGDKNKSVDDMLKEFMDKKKRLLRTFKIDLYNIPSAIARRIENVVDSVFVTPVWKFYIPITRYVKTGAESMADEEPKTEKKPVKEEEVTITVTDPTTDEKKKENDEEGGKGVKEELAEIKALLTQLIETLGRRETSVQDAEKSIEETSGRQPGIAKGRIDKLEKAVLELTDIVEKIAEKVNEIEKKITKQAVTTDSTANDNPTYGGTPIKPGDTVTIVEAPFNRPDAKGKTGTVVSVDLDKNTAVIRLEDGTELVVGLDKLELAKSIEPAPAVTKVAKGVVAPRPFVANTDVNTGGDERLEIIQKILRGELKPIDILKQKKDII